jgi:hypothetical protein
MVTAMVTGMVTGMVTAMVTGMVTAMVTADTRTQVLSSTSHASIPSTSRPHTAASSTMLWGLVISSAPSQSRQMGNGT